MLTIGNMGTGVLYNIHLMRFSMLDLLHQLEVEQESLFIYIMNDVMLSFTHTQ